MNEFIISNIDEFNTSEGYFGDAQIEDERITIPYINMGLMSDHPLNMSTQQTFIDFCFLQLVCPRYVSIYGKGIIKNDLSSYDPKKSQYFGGVFIGRGSPINGEMEIQASEILLIIPKGFKSSNNIWIPDYKEYQGRGNIKEEEVLSFFKRLNDLKDITIKI